MERIPPSVCEPVLLHGDCLDMLPGLPDASVHVVVTDPPAGIGFMAKSWDSFRNYEPRTARGREVAPLLEALGLAAWARGFVVFLVDVWSEVDRVLKPGGFVCAWALPKTADLAGLAMRLVGWDLHESVCHLFGSGMNKSGCIGKQIDKARPDDPRTRMVCRWLRAEMDARSVTSKDIAAAFGFHPRMADHWAARDTDSQPATPRLDQVPTLLDVLGIEDPPPEIADALLALNDAKGTPGEAWWRREVVSVREDRASIDGTRTVPIMGGGTVIESRPATEAAKRWTGWHSQIAPGHEQWLIARKPSRLTYAQQVQTHGCGAFHVDACRVPRGEAEHEAKAEWYAKYGDRDYAHGITLGLNNGDAHRRISAPHPSGSHPRNVVLTTGGDGCPAAGLDRQSGVLTSGIGAVRRETASGHQGQVYGATSQPGGTPQVTHGDSGGASRYFTRFDQVVGYYPKASDRRVPGRSNIRNEVAKARILAAIGSPESAAEANEQAPDGAQLGLL